MGSIELIVGPSSGHYLPPPDGIVAEQKGYAGKYADDKSDLTYATPQSLYLKGRRDPCHRIPGNDHPSADDRDTDFGRQRGHAQRLP